MQTIVLDNPANGPRVITEIWRRSPESFDVGYTDRDPPARAVRLKGSRWSVEFDETRLDEDVVRAAIAAHDPTDYPAQRPTQKQSIDEALARIDSGKPGEAIEALKTLIGTLVKVR